MPVPDPTAIELREARTWRVVTLCCDSSEPDWHAAGQVVRAGDDVMVELQGAFDGRCGWDDGYTPRVELDGVALAVRPLLVEAPDDLKLRQGETWLGPPPDAEDTLRNVDAGGYRNPTGPGPGGDSVWLAAIPTRTPDGPHLLTMRYRSCSWSGSVRIGLPTAAPPPLPVPTEDGHWIVVAGYGAAMWFCGDPYEASAEGRIGVPRYPCQPPQGGDSPPSVICVVDASGNGRGAWRIDGGADPPNTAQDGSLWYGHYTFALTPIGFPACDGLR